ncbi:MAG: Fic family protein [Patescibacteria group bacterium]|mgnify:CR=1 FL=1
MVLVPEARFMARFIKESEAIEGIYVNEKEIYESLLRGDDLDYVGAFTRLFREIRYGNFFLTREIICDTQRLIVENQHKRGERKLLKKYVGAFRDIPVSIGGELRFPDCISNAIQELVLDANEWLESWFLPAHERVQRIADFHFYFENIHPFADGNGRTGRALVYALFKNFRMTPFIFTNCDKHETYYRCFRRKEDMRLYFKIRAERAEEEYTQIQKEYEKNGMLDFS